MLRVFMRPWWQDVLIQAAGSILAAGVVALAAVLLGVIGSASLQTWTRIASSSVGLAVGGVAVLYQTWLTLGFSRRTEDDEAN
jgi:hypothetical protein